MKYLALITMLLISSYVQADSLTIGSSPVINGLDPIVSLNVIGKGNQHIANRDRRHEAAAALLLGIVKPEAEESKIAQADNEIAPEWVGHDVDHGLGDGLIINDPDYYKPDEKTTIKQ